MASRLTLVTGGARSGKSTFAEKLATAGRQPVLYVATAEAGDDEMRARIAEHQRRRPAAWRTVEATAGLAGTIQALTPAPGTVLLEDLALLASNLLLRVTGPKDPTPAIATAAEAAIEGEIQALEQARRGGDWDLIVVTNEVGFGVVPPTPLGRVFRDLLGRANQSVAALADDVYLVVAGISLCLKRDGMPASRPFL